LNVDIADTDKLLFPTLEPVYVVGEEIVPNFTEQTLNEWEIVLIPPENCECISIDESTGHLRAIAPGNALIKMRLKNYDAKEPRRAVTKEFSITINASAEDRPIYIYGPDKVRLDRYATYALVEEGKEDSPLTDVTMEIDGVSEYGTLEADKEKNYLYVLHANNENKLGSLILKTTYNNQEYTKTVEIIPLW